MRASRSWSSYRAARPWTTTGKGEAGACRPCSGSRTGSGASSTSYTRSALLRTRWRYCTASGSPRTASKAASGVSTTTAITTPPSRPAATPCAPTAAVAVTVRPQIRAVSPSPRAVAVAVREAIRVRTPSARRASAVRAGRAAGDGQLGGAGEQIGHAGRQLPAGRGQPALGAAGHGTREERDADSGGQQTHGERGTGLRQQPGREAHGGRRHQGRGTGGQQPAQPVVLQRVHIRDEPREQIPRRAVRSPAGASRSSRRYTATRVSASIRSTASCDTSRSAYRNTARPIPKARVAVTATIRYSTGGCCEAREISHPEVAISPTALPSARLPRSSARASRPRRGPDMARTRASTEPFTVSTSLASEPPTAAAPASTTAASGAVPSVARTGVSPSLRQPHHPVGHPEQRRAVHHQQDGPSGREPPYRRDDLRLGGPVERRRRFVEEQHGPVREERACQRQPLPLSGGEPGPVLAEHGVGPQGQRVHELPRPRVRQRLPYGRVVRVGAGQPDVLGDRAG